MSVRFEYATHDELPRIVEIYNEIIPSRLATADLEPVSVASRENWFAEFNHETRPLWVMKVDDQIAGWVGWNHFMADQHTRRLLRLVFTLTQIIVTKAWDSRQSTLSVENWNASDWMPWLPSFSATTCRAKSSLSTMDLRFGDIYRMLPKWMGNGAVWIFWENIFNVS